MQRKILCPFALALLIASMADCGGVFSPGTVNVPSMSKKINFKMSPPILFTHEKMSIKNYNIKTQIHKKGAFKIMKKFLLSLMLVLFLSSVASAALPSVVMLSTQTCPACVQMSKVLKDLRAKYPNKLTTAHIYLENNPDIAKKYNIRYVPTLIFRDSNGNEIAKEVGYRSVDEVIKIFANAGVKI